MTMRPTMLCAVLFGTMALSVLTAGQSAKPAPQLNVVGTPVIIVDTLCSSGTGATTIRLRNDGPATTLDLTSDDIAAKSSDKTLQGTKLTLSPKEPQNVAGRQEWEVAATVSGVYDEGDYETTHRSRTPLPAIRFSTCRRQRPECAAWIRNHPRHRRS